jgi:hypothetical protein
MRVPIQPASRAGRSKWKITSSTSEERSRSARRDRVEPACLPLRRLLRAGHARGAPASADARVGPLPLRAIPGADGGPAWIYRERTCEAANINPRITSPAWRTGSGANARRSSARSAVTRSTAARLFIPGVLIATLLMEGGRSLRVNTRSVKASVGARASGARLEEPFSALHHPGQRVGVPREDRRTDVHRRAQNALQARH